MSENTHTLQAPDRSSAPMGSRPASPAPERPRVLLGLRRPQPDLSSSWTSRRSSAHWRDVPRARIPGCLEDVARVICSGSGSTAGTDHPAPKARVVPKPPAPLDPSRSGRSPESETTPSNTQQSRRNPKVAAFGRGNALSLQEQRQVPDLRARTNTQPTGRRSNPEGSPHRDIEAPAHAEALTGSREYRSLRLVPQLAPVGAGTLQGWLADPRVETSARHLNRGPRCWCSAEAGTWPC